MSRIIPHLWYDDAAEEAAARYVALFPDAALGEVARYSEVGRDIHRKPPGSVMTRGFRIGDSELVALNGGTAFRFTPAISLFATLESEAEVDRVWAGLLDGGTVSMPLDSYPWSRRYGWLVDRWGVNWQIALGSRAASGGAVVPVLTFTQGAAGRAEEAMNLYVATFANSEVEGVLRYDGSGVNAAGTVQHAQFRLLGETLAVMDSAEPRDDFAFTEAVSLIALCEDQAEIDRYFAALSAVPDSEQCGWLKDRFGVSWQIVPRVLGPMLTGDPARAKRVMEVFMEMRKLDIAALERAAAEPSRQDA